MQTYILIDRQPIPCDDLRVWGEWFENTDNRRVALDDVNGAEVSTVFLGIDHNFSSHGPPLLFETMVFFDGNDVEAQRYATWDAAVAGHAALVAKYKAQARNPL